jgi:exosortase/archaeosortase family protein
MNPRGIDGFTHRLDRLPPAVWLALLGAAMWPHSVWMARRMLDGSDDPLGIVALAALACLGWRHRGHLRRAPRPAWFCSALVFMMLAGANWQALPPLFSTLLALLGFAAGMLSLLPGGVAPAPVLGLAALSLPLMASLQFYAGYPLRLVAAELSRWLLLVAHHVERDGVALRVDGQLVLVDAACSGVQLVWLGYFTACAAALLGGCGNPHFLRRLPAVGALILAGNVRRNTALIALQADGKPVAAWLHEGIGLVTLAVVCALIFHFIREHDAAPCNSTWRKQTKRDRLPFRSSPDKGRTGGVCSDKIDFLQDLPPQTPLNPPLCAALPHLASPDQPTAVLRPTASAGGRQRVAACCPCRGHNFLENPDNDRAAPSPALSGTLSPKGLGEREQQAAALRQTAGNTAVTRLRALERRRCPQPPA